MGEWLEANVIPVIGQLLHRLEKELHQPLLQGTYSETQASTWIALLLDLSVAQELSLWEHAAANVQISVPHMHLLLLIASF